MLTPYKAAKFVNEQLEKAGLEKKVPPQMLYNYTSSRLNAGKKPLIAYTIEKGVDQKDLERWTKAYIEKLQQKAKELVEA
jgi:hypothetical protein